MTALHRGEILAGDSLPLRYTAYSPCFRKEAGAAGKDTRGLMRLHQFEKVELVWLTRPEDSVDALDTLTAHAAEALLDELGCRIASSRCARPTSASTPRRHMTSKSGCPGRDVYREISSCSNCTDFQARRGQMRFRRDAARSRNSSTRSTGRGSRSGGRWSRSSKTTATGRKRPLPPRSSPTPVSTASRRRSARSAPASCAPCAAPIRRRRLPRWRRA